MDLSKLLAKCRRLPLLFIFFQNALAIIFNAYNLVVFLLRMASSGIPNNSLNLGMILLFYGFSIVTSFMKTLTMVIIYHKVYEEVIKTFIFSLSKI